MVERVARAVATTLHNKLFAMNGYTKLPHALEKTDEVVAEVTHAAIIAMREPTDLMIVRGDDELIKELNNHTFALNGGDTPAHKTWRAMIDAALPASALMGTR